MKIALLGMPGSGKTTLARRLAGLGLFYISSGDLARANGFAGSQAESQGQLDPDEDKIVRLVRGAVRGKNSYVLDGFPRQSGQAQKVPIDMVLYLDVGRGTAINRLLKRDRPDDKIPTIHDRLRVYDTFTVPLLSQYDDLGTLHTIDASRSPDDTFVQAILVISGVNSNA